VQNRENKRVSFFGGASKRLFVLAPNIRPVTILFAVDKKLPLPKKQAADSYRAGQPRQFA
jgi:hypothetical protein